ncbi:MAG: hypothetical protein AAGA77_22370 [Bacteroidota bacterium]
MEKDEEMKEINDKYNKLVNSAKLPLPFLYLHEQDEATNHELRRKLTFHSRYFNNSRMTFWPNPFFRNI